MTDRTNNTAAPLARRIVVRGIVQGVGFRPFVFRQARALDLVGTVANTSRGVIIEAQGAPDSLKQLEKRLRDAPPPASRITEIVVTPIPASREHDRFTILPSKRGERPATQISPDIAVCPDCVRELFDQADRRFHYPFINCTNCGPRFSIVEAVPYDRPNTSMKVFPLCRDCEREYRDPADRRFHAQPNACPDCGPSLDWRDGQGRPLAAADPVSACVRALAAGRVVAIRGLGGFHLAVDATDGEAVARLRRRKHRPSKPLAIMVRDLDRAALFCRISDLERELLTSPQAPIVLLEKRPRTHDETDIGGTSPDKGPAGDSNFLSPVSCPLSPDTCHLSPVPCHLAPGLHILGVMLPYTPLHHLILAHPDCPAGLVMTSGNLSGEPICTGNDEALRRLAGVADFFLLHNREIVTRVDDSVVRVMGGRPRLLRRARGYAPQPLLLRQPTTNVLACGAEMKATFCLVRDQEAYLSQHIGELTTAEALDFYRESIDHLNQVLEPRIGTVACDLHPDYLSSRYAEQLGSPVRIQHHHAHAAAVMAEWDLEGELLALVFDGTGLGPDQSVYGGEFYRVSRAGYTRLGHLPQLVLPGGDRAAREPWRMALALLSLQGGDWEETTALAGIEPEQRRIVREMIERGVNTPLTTSCGRLFDAVAALCGLCLVADYEGQAAMLLEAAAARCQRPLAPPPVMLRDRNGILVPDPGPLIEKILDLINRSEAPEPVAALFHHWLIQVSLEILTRLHRATGLDRIILAGGCMQNRILLEGLMDGCAKRGWQVYSGEQVPAGDGGIALGQAFIAGRPRMNTDGHG